MTSSSVAAVPLAEGRPLALAVVGEDDDRVVARRARGRPLERGERLVDAGQRAERLQPLGAGVVGQLVVVDEVDVHDRRAPAHRVR